MSILSGKHILLGVTAGIAAYKSASLVRSLIKAGASVRVVMTEAAKDFVTPLTLSTLSRNEVHSSFTKKEDVNAMWTNHVELGLWADLMIIAPATANTLSKMANGASDNLLLATYLSAKCPVYFAPAMDLDMYKHPSSEASFLKLQSYGNIMIPATSGELASGLIGKGRMAEPDDIVTFIESDVLSKLPLKGKRVLITAGPTYEAIDPVRFIGNHSSGMMGCKLALQAAALGAEVDLILGPSNIKVDHSLINVHNVVSGDEMYEAAHTVFKNCDIVIAAAAVADYKPVNVAPEKIKKDDKNIHIELTKTKDILSSLGAIKEKQYILGFALETENEVDNATKKLHKKNLDAIVLNSLNDKGAGFKTKTNKITFIEKNGSVTTYDLKSKAEVAIDIFEKITAQVV
ncbi:bifunctional phosphopantothenoylcysteine decarboxylase/phosphopantothenate--cysteine ligase CoaBC [Dokdonia sp. Hel_I_53]|uniref:bifunctional phosphopantothenoylcysteine decarboxylase/phosphopantothenate--cysteine ligase CoaBC n=1 Tax=Dokdonia sp. Hel_I_53 TaxID=1566287 RepID=UPI00119BFA11|nr:bifunctional phosphopantothenoylcysteine decarboxylase/phosphopantothenate--cysteine ligase CoaBC [Dokdonia sp. Hel_I_53]TVZ53268.1 phosphopantothenoylcysteine decarboxylase/phosphopantothenate--cysteine ligase [Dokdonia sp. Hel_I_53]